MREILFRGKSIVTNDFVFGYYYRAKEYREDTDLCDYIATPHPGERGIPSDHFMVTAETVGQYTGKDDKNGNKIFEGDIVRFAPSEKNRGADGIECVIYKNCQFGVLCGWHMEFVCPNWFANTTFEVVGNIYDTPELLGRRKGNE